MAASEFLLGRAAVADELADADLHRRRDRDRHQRAHDPEQRAAEERRDHHHERIEVDRAALDPRLHHVVLELLVDDREDRPDDRHRGEVLEQRDDADEDRPESGADQRNQVEDADHDRAGQGRGHAEDREHDERRGAGDESLQQRSGDVAGDRIGHRVAAPA